VSPRKSAPPAFGAIESPRRAKVARGKVSSRDRHALYEASVQSPEAEIPFFDRVYQEWNGHLPYVLREDFCGTAALSAAWAKAHARNRAYGVDLHLPTLAWGRKHHLQPMGAEAERVQLLHGDVRTTRTPKADVTAALNFSYFVFHTREGLRDYFRSARSHLAPGGLLILDIFGGWEAQALVIEKRRRPGFTYLWEQTAFDPITHLTTFHIHFRFPDGTERKRAFTYHWRLWSVPEVREALIEAGFRRSRVYWEGTDHATMRGNGVFRRTERAVTTPGWIGYIVAG
jgi:SAM-dependent methyltransferase